MAVLSMDFETSVANPVDLAEQVAAQRDWAFDRPIEEELIAEIAGGWCHYRLWFTWQEDLGGLMFSCSYDMKIARHAWPQIQELLALINERMWLGHFDLCSEDGGLSFRHGILLKGGNGITHEQLEELVDIAVSECERFYPAFQSVVWAGQKPVEALKFSMFDTCGEA